MSTAPFDSSAAQLVTQTHMQTLRLVAVLAGDVELDLDVVDYSIDWDETRAPRVQASFDVPVPLDQATLDALDPRTLVRLRVFVAYHLASGAVDEQQVAYLHLRRRRLRRGDSGDMLTLDAASGEMLFIEAAAANPTADPDSVFTAGNLKAAVAQYVLDLFAGTPLDGMIVNGPPSTTGSVDVPLSAHPWDGLSDLADEFDQNIYDPGDGTIMVAPRVGEVGDPAAALSIGSNGTILTSSSGISRDDWANWVTVTYQWTTTAGAELTVGGYASVVGGPYAPAAAGYRILPDPVRHFKGTTGRANAAARTILRRMLARSRSYTIEAVPAWWVRPESTITLQLPLGAQERHLVSRVGFAPGRMSIETRLPDTASIIGE